MRNQRGGVKLITLIRIVLVLTIILFGLVVYSKLTEGIDNEENVTNSENISQTNVIENTIENIVGDSNSIQEEPIAPVETKMDDFSMKFLQLENNQKNMIYSPLSIKYALKMLQEGANGKTYNQINDLIGNLNVPTYKNVDMKLSLANGGYIREKYSKYVKQDYINKLTSKYNAEVKYDAFINATNVNQWIENKTLGIIKNMLNDDLIQNPHARMLLLNALAIDMKWKSDFDYKDTNGKTFYMENGQEMVATTMHKETSSDDISYYVGDNITALTMDLEKCEDTELEFMAIMPDNNLKQYVDSLTTKQIDEITNKLLSASKTKLGVKISIPKFKFNYDLQLKKDLQSLGIKDAFDKNKADFSNMYKLSEAEENLYVSEALHKADIDFSEKGIKAAAVTVIAMEGFNAIVDPNQPKQIKIDKPFLFLIRDKNTKEIWFTGTVYEPNSWEDDYMEYQDRLF